MKRLEPKSLFLAFLIHTRDLIQIFCNPDQILNAAVKLVGMPSPASDWTKKGDDVIRR